MALQSPRRPYQHIGGKGGGGKMAIKGQEKIQCVGRMKKVVGGSDNE